MNEQPKKAMYDTFPLLRSLVFFLAAFELFGVFACPFFFFQLVNENSLSPKSLGLDIYICSLWAFRNFFFSKEFSHPPARCMYSYTLSGPFCFFFFFFGWSQEIIADVCTYLPLHPESQWPPPSPSWEKATHGITLLPAVENLGEFFMVNSLPPPHHP